MIYVFYHCPCHDGIYGALAAHRHFLRLGVEVTYVPHAFNASEEVREQWLSPITEFDDVYLIDNSGTVKFLLALCEKAGKVILLDHHKGAQVMIDKLKDSGEVPSNLSWTINMEKSGATIAMNYFGMTKEDATVLDTVFVLVEDHDLWRHKYDDSRAFFMGLVNLKLDMYADRNPSIFDKLMNLDVVRVIKEGHELVESMDARMAPILATASVIHFGDISCLYVTNTEVDLTSELGHRLSILGTQREGDILYPMGAIVRPPKDGKVSISLRSIGEFFCRDVAIKYGGEGHAQACGMLVSEEIFNSMIA
jgi:oligoribonuclease NrnB/cAMP/cGMP phosphodiesterase (DHH superfamily)